MVGKELHNTYQ